ncbi:MAG: choloylglycine hydrolase family protein [Pseudomonadota bacterium]
MRALQKSVFAVAVAAVLGVAQVAYACTGIMLAGSDGSVVRARTMEWGAFDIEGAISIVPPGYEMSSIMPDGSTGASWTVQYGFVGATGLGRLLTTDGVNTAGLSSGIFYLPGFAEYPEFDPALADQSLSPTDFVNYVLANFATVEEVRSAMEDLRIVNVVEPSLGFAAPVHYFVADPTGERLVIEVVDQEVHLHEAPLGVITNAPSYDWHMTNLRNYLNLSATELPQRTVAETDFSPLGSGSGMIGLPGDFTPPSRFVRAVAFSQSARQTTGGYDTVREAFRILDNFNVPAHGVTHNADDHGGLVLSSTQFTSAVDMGARQFFYHTQHNRRVRMVDLNDVDFDALGGEPVTRMMDQERVEDIETLTFGN